MINNPMINPFGNSLPNTPAARDASLLVRPFAAPALFFEKGLFDTPALSQQEQDNLRLYDHERRMLAHSWDVQTGQLADWAEAQADALDEAYAVCCTLPCSLTQARRWQTDESDTGRAKWKSFLAEVQHARLVDFPPPVVVVDTLADLEGMEGTDTEDAGRKGHWDMMTCGFLAGAPLLWWVLNGGVWGGVAAAVALTGAIICGFVGWGARAAAGQEWADGDEEDAA